MRNIADLLALSVVRIVVGLMRLLPWKASRVFARGIVAVVLMFFPRSSSVARRNLEIAFPEKSEEERMGIYRRSLWVLADNLVGFAKVPDITSDNIAARFDMAREVEQAEAHRQRIGGGPLILVTAHIGAFEELIHAVALLMHPMGILARAFGLERLDRWWINRRQLTGSEIIERAGAYREVVARLQCGKDVAMLIDQNVKANHAVFVDFFGIKAATTKTVALAALRTGAGVIFASPLSTGLATHRIFYREINTRLGDELSVEEKVAKITQDLNHAIEACIREQPESWFWIHRRFKTRPPGEPETIYR